MLSFLYKIMGRPGIELRPLGLLASAFIHWPILPAPNVTSLLVIIHL